MEDFHFKPSHHKKRFPKVFKSAVDQITDEAVKRMVLGVAFSPLIPMQLTTPSVSKINFLTRSHLIMRQPSTLMISHLCIIFCSICSYKQALETADR